MKKEPFEINISEETLTDLYERLAKTRWPDEIGNQDQENWGQANNTYSQKLGGLNRDLVRGHHASVSQLPA